MAYRGPNKKNVSKIEKAMTLLAKGETSKDAAKAVGLTPNTIFKYKKIRDSQGAPAIGRLIPVSQAPAANGRVMVFVGSAEDVAQAVRGIQ